MPFTLAVCSTSYKEAQEAMPKLNEMQYFSCVEGQSAKGDPRGAGTLEEK